MRTRNPKPWRKLDNTALLFMADNGRRDSKVFRFYCELNEPVQPARLQLALTQTLQLYPVFLTHLRRGLFWYYFEASDLQPEVREEYKDPCMPIYIRDKKRLLFEVTYYQNRINFEVFHALTDGTGATAFLRELVRQYLLACHPELPAVTLLDERITTQDMEVDGFSKYYTGAKVGPKQHKRKAFQLKKIVPAYKKLQVSETTVSVRELLAKSRELGVSMTVLLTAVLICAIHREMPRLQEDRPVVLMVPVNLRKFFPTESMMNFFGWIEPAYDFSREQPDFPSVLAAVKQYFKDQLTAAQMEAHINKYLALERLPIVKFFPLILKNIAIRIGARQTRDDLTAVYSNMSVVSMPAEYRPFIKRFGVFTSTPKLELCMCSYEDTVSLGFTARFDTTNIQRNFHQLLEEIGVKSTVVPPQYPVSDTPALTGLKLYKAFSYLCILAAVVCLAVNFLFTKDSWWSLIAGAGIASLWAALSLGYYKRYNLLKDVMWLYVLFSGGSIIWDAALGWSGWSVDFVFPAISIVVLITMLIITKLQAHTAREYMIYFLMAAVYGMLVDIILVATGVVHFIHLSVAAAVIGFLVVILLMLFKWKEFKEELAKKFHV